jgi:nucleotide-binding universal stress UspA family protein
VYRRVGVATTFSPRFMAVLAEAGRLSASLEAPLCLIHADSFAPDKESRFRQALKSLGLDEKAPIFFESDDPVEAILKVQQEQQIDLLVAGALETESVHRNFTGNVARELLKRAPCDLMFYTEPREQPAPPAVIFVAISDFSEFSREVFGRAMKAAEQRSAQKLTLIHVQTTFAQAREKALGAACESQSLEETVESWLQEYESSPVELDYHLLRGNTGFTACEYVQANGADLLVMPSHFEHPTQPVFPPALDWIIQVIPTNVWIIRKIG